MSDLGDLTDFDDAGDFDAFAVDAEEYAVDTVDMNQDGYEETLFVDTDRDGDHEAMFLDDNQDGQFEAAIFDTDNDGTVDFGVRDTDGDGTIDEEGKDLDADGLAEIRNVDTGEIVYDPEPPATPINLVDEASSHATNTSASNDASVSSGLASSVSSAVADSGSGNSDLATPEANDASAPVPGPIDLGDVDAEGAVDHDAGDDDEPGFAKQESEPPGRGHGEEAAVSPLDELRREHPQDEEKPQDDPGPVEETPADDVAAADPALEAED